MRVIPTKGRKEIEKLAPEIEMFFKEEQCQVLGQSFRKPGQVMHEKEWITYVNRETDKVRKGLDCNNVFSPLTPSLLSEECPSLKAKRFPLLCERRVFLVFDTFLTRL